MPETPEQKARHANGANLTEAGWLVQERDALDLTAGRGIAVCEFPLKPGFGFADYLLYLDRKAVGAVEAKAEGTLTGVEAQSAKYAAGLPDNLPAHSRPLPFLFESNGAVTQFTNGLDPVPRSRQVFNFPRPETLSDWARPDQLRRRLQQMPELDESRLWDVQARAIRALETSFGRADSRALIQMATGSGKTRTAVNVAPTVCSNTPAPGASCSWWIAAISASRPSRNSTISSHPTTPASSRRSIPSSGSRPIRSILPPRWWSPPSSASIRC